MVPTAVVVLAQVPPAVASVSVAEVPVHIMPPPDMAAGNGLTVTRIVMVSEALAQSVMAMRNESVPE